MTKLKRNMEAVEIVRQHQSALRKRNRVAVAVAAVSGFIVGVILTLLYPLIGDWISMFFTTHLRQSVITVDYSLTWWIVVAVVCAITTLNAYEIAMAKLSRNM